MPGIDAIEIVEAKGDDIGGEVRETGAFVIHIKEAEVAAHTLCITETERGMVLTELDEVAVIVEHLRVLAQVLPPESVDAVGRLEAVVHPFLIAQHLLAAEHERHTLGGEHCRLSQQVETDELVVADARQFRTQTVDKTHVIVAGDIADLLCRLAGPRCLAIVHLAHVDLRMGDSPHDAELHTLLLTRDTGEEGTFVVIAERTTEGVAQVIAERTDARQLLHVCLHGQLLRGIGALACAPSLTIDIDAGVDGMELIADGVHRRDVVHPHEIEAEAVDMVLLHPVAHAGKHEGTHDGLVGRRLIAAARAIARRAVGIETIVGVGPRLLEVAVVEVEGMVVDHVEDDAYTRLMERLHHLLELTDAAGRIVGIGAVAALRYVIVQWVIAPVVLRLVELSLVNRGIVERRQDMDGIDTEALQVTDGPRFGERKELTGVLRSDALVEHRRIVVDIAPDREVTDVHLIDDEVGR